VIDKSTEVGVALNLDSEDEIQKKFTIKYYEPANCGLYIDCISIKVECDISKTKATLLQCYKFWLTWNYGTVHSGQSTKRVSPSSAFLAWHTCTCLKT